MLFGMPKFTANVYNSHPRHRFTLSQLFTFTNSFQCSLCYQMPEAARTLDLELGSDGSSDVERVALDEIPYSCSILWTPIHPITWVAPFVGHMGITDSQGRLHDWGGGPIRPCTPRLMMFGEPARYIQLHPKDARAWDAAIAQADDEYSHYIHCMLLGSDCHSHVARVLNILRSGGCSCHNKVVLASAVCVGPRLCTLMAVALPRTFSPLRPSSTFRSMPSSRASSRASTTGLLPTPCAVASRVAASFAGGIPDSPAF
jgi:hypothetical protein